ncbi:hypothetical protein TIFTF001_050949 [Ficus carica]|uniref:SANT domain-containing protein n=1 Tax=Ficus carica TaxID=3494 RepID=A0AA87YVF1_FICCA|nr:hypothetical protein TIFTF001_050946 [Ficus carica]GMN19621.1 hypothetical protein TIFTF001_050947 [Ficus carica]GMN19632.1 hypothetical protein TIFTF001_050948 [Ficus carica]GMN19640.1 hypothetical protein TIFTF001_050949 [Ficus carica]
MSYSYSQLSSPNSNPNWTVEQNKLFENALAIYDREEPDRWCKIAKVVGGTTEEEVKRQYEILQEDINRIESGKIPLPKYRKDQGSSKENNISNEEQRILNILTTCTSNNPRINEFVMIPGIAEESEDLTKSDIPASNGRDKDHFL